MPSSSEQSQKDYYIRNLHSYIKKDDLNAFIDILNKRPNLLKFKSFKNENILFYSLMSGSKKISSYLITHKPELLLERNNLGRNCAQNLASKKLDLSLFFKGLSLLSPQNAHLLFANIDNLGNNLLMYCSLYDDINVYNKATQVCPNVSIIQKSLNKKKSNILHFLASNPYSSGNIAVSKHSSELFTQLTSNNTSILMFAAENQPTNVFKQYIEEFKKQLSTNEFNQLIQQRNLLNLNVLEFAFLNQNPGNVKFLLKNYGQFFNKEISSTSLQLILKQIQKNKNTSAEMLSLLLEHFEPFKDDQHINSSIIKLAIQSNEHNPDLLNAILKTQKNLISELFLSDSTSVTSIYQNTLEKIKPSQWKVILENISNYSEDHDLNTNQLNAIFNSMMYNPKLIVENLEVTFDFLKNKYPNIAYAFIAEKLLFLPETQTKQFLEKTDFIQQCNNQRIIPLQYLLQELYDIPTDIQFDTTQKYPIIMSQHSLLNLLNYHSGLDLKKISKFQNIVSSPVLYQAFNHLSDFELSEAQNLLMLDKPFSSFKEIDKIMNPHKSISLFNLVLNEMQMLKYKSIMSYSEWQKFQEITIKNKSLSNELLLAAGKDTKNNFNESYEFADNLFTIFVNDVMNNSSFAESVDFFKFISQVITPVGKTYSLSFKKGVDYLVNKLQEQTEIEQQSFISDLVEINHNLVKKELLFFIPENILKKAVQKDKALYNKDKKHFLKNLILSSVFDPKTKNYDISAVLFFFAKDKLNKTELDEIVQNIELHKYIPENQFLFSNCNNSKLNNEVFSSLFFPDLSTPDNDMETISNLFSPNGFKININDVNSLLKDYLESNQIEKALSLCFIISRTNTFSYSFNLSQINKENSVTIDINKLDNPNCLLIYHHHNIEGLIPHKDLLSNIISKNLSQASHFEKILYISIADKLGITDNIANFYNQIVKPNSSESDAEKYLNFTYNFLLKNKDATFLQNVDYTQIQDPYTALTLEENFLNKHSPSNKTKKVKVNKY